MRIGYPWSAVVGQEALKRALLLSAIDPAIGGVLVQGPRGVAKTTLARALAELCPGRFVELPLAASEERVTGTLDLEAALRDGRLAFAPGLLAQAHEGVLYVDEVNLLPDALVDLLLDAAASGQNVVERDGISHAHPARFVLIGTMNPEEGELRPQLSDRFGLSVHADHQLSPAERREILTRRLAFDADPEAFVTNYAAAQRDLRERCRVARARCASIALSGAALEWVSERCHAARVEGVRADLAMLRAARAQAAWVGRSEIGAHDIDAVAELALAHRAPDDGDGPPSGGPTSGGAGRSGRQPNARQPASTSGVRSDRAQSHAEPTDTRSDPASTTHAPDSLRTEHSTPSASASGPRLGALAPVPVPVAAVPALDRTLVDLRLGRAEARRRGAARVPGARGARAELAARGAVDWFATLARFHPRSPATNMERALPSTLTPRELRFRARRRPRSALWVLAIDCSASMLRGGALSAAKGVMLAFAGAARRAGAHLACISFQGAGARLLGAFGAQQRTHVRAVRALGAAGATPLSAALREALALCRHPQFARPGVEKRVVLLTDGRTLERPTALASRHAQASLLVIDCERGPVRLGGSAALARTLGARALHVDALLWPKRPARMP